MFNKLNNFSFLKEDIYLIFLNFILYGISVVFGIYTFVGSFNNMYLIHFGNSISISIMTLCKSKNIKIIIPWVSFGVYSIIRIFQQPWYYVLTAGSLNVIEQYLGFIIYIGLTKNINSFKFITDLFLQIGLGLSLLFAIPGSLFFHLLENTPWGTVFLVYFFSHVSGNFSGLYIFSILYNYYPWKIPKKYWIEYLFVILIIVVSFSFKNYNIGGIGALLITYPLLAILASRYNQDALIFADITIMLLVYIMTALKRGPIYNISHNLQDLTIDPLLFTVFTLYLYMISTEIMSAYICIGMQLLRKSLNDIINLKNDISFMFSQTSHDMRLPLMHINYILYDIIKGYNFEKKEINYCIEECNDLMKLMDIWLVALNKSSSNSNLKLEKTIEEININTLIEQLYNYTQKTLVLKENSQSIQLIFNNIEFNDYIETDLILLTQICKNLLSNAIKYCNNGYIEFNTNIIIEANSEEYYRNAILCLKVIDTGIGIEEEHLKSLFSMFDNKKNIEKILTQNHGFGLYIVKRFTSILDGDIQAESKVNIGTTFTLKIPVTLKEKRLSIDIENELITNFSLSNYKLLIVEDDIISIKILQRFLINSNTEIIKDGNKCIDKIKEFNPDIILLDGNLENNTCGEDIINELHNNYELYNKNLIIIIISGRIVKIPNDLKYRYSICPKPFSKEKLEDNIKKLILS
jgi:signal transduction histidine kinase/CheY-like chemotaxis protein